MVLSQQALQAHVDRLDTGLASVVEAQQASTEATLGLGAQIQQLLGKFSHMDPSSPPGLGSQSAVAPAQEPSETAPSSGAGQEAAVATAGEHTGESPTPVKAAGKGKTGTGGYSPH